MASIVESCWLYLITHFSDFQLACLGSFFLHESVFFLSGIPFIYLERAGWLSKYKIQTKNNSAAAQEKCITRLILYHLCVNLPVMIASYPVFKFMGMRSSLPLPSWKVISTQILFYFILEDFVFYWGHRTLHTKWLYKHVHNVHHEYATPFGLTSEYAHPAEILFLGFATIVGPAITGPHLLTLWLWMVLRVLETVEAHSGYHFPWSPSNFLPLYGGADFHDYHHRLLYTKSGNYSSTFVYMDRLSDRLMKSPCLVIRLGIQYSWSPKFQVFVLSHRLFLELTWFLEGFARRLQYSMCAPYGGADWKKFW